MSSHPGGGQQNAREDVGGLPQGPDGRRLGEGYPGQGRGLDPEEEALEREARAHVSALRGFYGHAAIFVAVNLLLLAMNLLTD